MKPSMIHQAFLTLTYMNKLLKTRVVPSTQGQTRKVSNKDTELVNKIL